MGVVDDRRPGGDLRLPSDAGQEGSVDPAKVGVQACENPGILGQRQAEEFGHQVAGDVVGRRAQATRDEDEVGASNRVQQRLADRRAVRDADLPVHAQAQWKKLQAEKGQVRVGDVAEQQLGAGVDDFDFHGVGRNPTSRKAAPTQSGRRTRKNVPSRFGPDRD